MLSFLVFYESGFTMGKGYGETLKKLLVSIGIFAGAVLIMCLAAKVMMSLDEETPVAAATEQTGQTVKEQEKTEKVKEEQGLDKSSKANEIQAKEDKLTLTDKHIQADVAEVRQEPKSNDPLEQDKLIGKEEIAFEEAENVEILEPVVTPVPKVTPAPKATPVPEVTPIPAVYDIPQLNIDRTKLVVALNAAHQKEADLSPEPLGPGATETKARSGWDSEGIATGMPENELTLIIAKKVKAILEDRGYQVLMLRDENTPSISDAMRAQTANAYADIAVHIHANWDDNYDITGIMAFYPSEDNPYAADYSEPCLELSKAILKGLKASTGAKSWGAIDLDTQSTLNWTKIPASHVEVGYMSNAKEDALMGTEEYRDKIAVGIADGIDLYFSER